MVTPEASGLGRNYRGLYQVRAHEENGVQTGELSHARAATGGLQEFDDRRRHHRRQTQKRFPLGDRDQKTKPRLLCTINGSIVHRHTNHKFRARMLETGLYLGPGVGRTTSNVQLRQFASAFFHKLGRSSTKLSRACTAWCL